MYELGCVCDRERERERENVYISVLFTNEFETCEIFIFASRHTTLLQVHETTAKERSEYC